jgi:ribosome-binding factor A
MAPRKHVPRRPGNPQFARKTAQLCRQVERRLGLAFAELDDDHLASLMLVEVQAAPDGSRLRLDLQRPPAQVERAAGLEPVSDIDLLERLGRVRGLLRDEVAAAINRRKTPELDFRILADPPAW